jgi:hypothetical protein
MSLLSAATTPTAGGTCMVVSFTRPYRVVASSLDRRNATFIDADAPLADHDIARHG